MSIIQETAHFSVRRMSFGLFFIVGGGIISSIIPLLGIFGTGLFIILGVLSLADGILSFFIAKGLPNAKKWTRTLIIIFGFISLISSIYFLTIGQVLSGIFSILFNLLILGYLLFSKKVKEFFA
jgi:hypothetical protein